jgi:hypothetical protein
MEARFQPAWDGGGEIHGAISTLMSIAFLPAVPRLFWQRVFVWLMRVCEAQPDLIGVEDQDAVVTEGQTLYMYMDTLHAN